MPGADYCILLVKTSEISRVILFIRITNNMSLQRFNKVFPEASHTSLLLTR